MKITTWNVNGIRAREAQVLEWVKLEAPDVMCLQEIKASPKDVPESLCSLEGYWCYWHGHKGYSGVGLHLRKQAFPEPPRFVHPAFDHETRIVSVELPEVTISSIYVPNGGKDYPAKVRFLSEMDGYVAKAQAEGRRLILCGDLNVARSPIDVHPALRKPNQIGQTPEEQAMLEGILQKGLTDLGRERDPQNDRLFTWWAPWRNLKQKNVGWRLDYVLCSQALSASCTRCQVYREFGTSDHAPVAATFDI